LPIPEVRHLCMPRRLPVDDIVAMAAPGVEHDSIIPRLPVEEAGRSRKALRALGDGLFAAGNNLVVHAMASAIISPAVALADPTTTGMPAPGCVPAPTIYMLEITSSRLCGRNQALWVRIGSIEKAEPRWALSSSRKSKGVKWRTVTRSSS